MVYVLVNKDMKLVFYRYFEDKHVLEDYLDNCDPKSTSDYRVICLVKGESK